MTHVMAVGVSRSSGNARNVTGKVRFTNRLLRMDVLGKTKFGGHSWCMECVLSESEVAL